MYNSYFPHALSVLLASFLEDKVKQSTRHFHWELSAQFIVLFVDWIIYVSCAMLEFFVYYTYTHLVIWIEGKDFLPYCGLYFHWANHPFVVQNSFYFMQSVFFFLSFPEYYIHLEFGQLHHLFFQWHLLSCYITLDIRIKHKPKQKLYLLAHLVQALWKYKPTNA